MCDKLLQNIHRFETVAVRSHMTRRGGPVVTMKVVKYAEITDISKIPLEVLRPYLKPSAIEVAVNAWARATEFSATLPGVTVGERNESVVL